MKIYPFDFQIKLPSIKITKYSNIRNDIRFFIFKLLKPKYFYVQSDGLFYLAYSKWNYYSLSELDRGRITYWYIEKPNNVISGVTFIGGIRLKINPFIILKPRIIYENKYN
jgi:hypothetical protein